MSEITTDTRNDLADTRWILAETHRALQDARQQLRQMDESTNDARSWLSLVEGVQQGRVTSMDRESQGEAFRSFAAACEEAGEAGLGVDRRISRAVANLKAAVVMVDGLQPGSPREEIDTGRLRRQLISLQEDLETTRPVMRHVSERLGTEADHARQALPRPGRDRVGFEVTSVSGSLLTAYSEGRHVDQELRRAQSVTIQASRGADLISQAEHDPVAASHTDRVLILSDGRVVDEIWQPTRESVLDAMMALSAHPEVHG